MSVSKGLIPFFALLGGLFSSCTETYYPCQQNAKCFPMDMICIDGRCIPDDGRPLTCELDIECRYTERCRDGICSNLPACTSDNDCPGGYYCHVLQGDCIPSQTSCSSNDDCRPGQHCDMIEKTCVASECQADADCPPEQVCDLASFTCGAAGLKCESDADCMAGQRCDTLAGICRHGGWCLGDQDCSASEYCDRSTGVCRTSSTDCASDADCTPGPWCDTQSGDCRTGCRSDADCPEGTTCETDSGACLPPSGCQNDNDCPSGYRCDNGECVVNQGQVPDGSICETNADCQSANCVSITTPSVCLSPCRSSTGCPPNWSCVEVTSAWFCVSESLLTQVLGMSIDVGSGEYGAYCSGQPVYNPYCHSMICNQNQNICTTDCMTDADCGYGSICRVNYETGIMRAYCFVNPGLGTIGTYCEGDYYCAFNVCLSDDGYSGFCSSGCCSSADCPSGWACGRLQSNDPYAPGFAKACFTAEWPGTALAGSGCTSDGQCKSNLCIGGICSDLCCTDADCPAPMRCQITVDVNNLAVTLCL
ncbi:MAG: hypothetical protein JRJ19_10755 [Deltaproteobacteria bacterium]|nr:hypothetical protein [Deltaproteobacteria bacterium]